MEHAHRGIFYGNVGYTQIFSVSAMQTLMIPAPLSSPSGLILSTEPGIRRRKTRSVPVGSIMIGSEHPVAVQSMINEDTLDIEGSVAGIRRLHEIGCEIVRVTVPSMAHAKAMEQIRDRLHATYQPVPLVADEIGRAHV